MIEISTKAEALLASSRDVKEAVRGLYSRISLNLNREGIMAKLQLPGSFCFRQDWT
jgi:hypothetical protein